MLRDVILFGLAWLTGTCVLVDAHPVPFSYIDVRSNSAASSSPSLLHTFDLANDLKIQPPEKLLEPDTLERPAERNHEAAPRIA